MTRKLSDKEIEQIISYYERGLSRNEIKERTGRSLSTINKYTKQHLQKEIEFECPNNHHNTLKRGHIFRKEGKKFYPCAVCNCAYKTREVDLK
jgi:ssDNA-binding Zn-finger/Zn-ribbon topoisomerase 1